MGKLMKYEFLRRKNFLIIAFVIMLVMEAAVLFGIFKGEGWLALSIILTVILVVGGIGMPFIDCIANYYSDYKNKHGYMMFLTPNSGYAIIGAKALTSFVILVGSALVVVGSLLASYHFSLGLYPQVAQEISQIKADFPFEIFGVSPGAAIVLFSGAVLMQYMYNIMLVMLAITIAKTALPGKQFNVFFALLFYIGVTIVVQIVNNLVLAGAGFVGDMIKAVTVDNPLIINIGKYMIVGLVMYLIWMAISYIASSMLVNKRTDL